MARIKFTVKGKMPGMLQHNPVNTMTAGAPKPGPKHIPSVEEEAELGTYRDEDGNLQFPISCVKKSMLEGAKGHKMGRTYMTTTIRSNVLDVYSPDGDMRWLHLTDSDGEPLRDYKVDVQRVVIGTASVLRARPLLEEWYTTLIIEYDDAAIDAKLIEKYLNRAGYVVGWGDYRPEKGGIFGRFEVVKSQVMP